VSPANITSSKVKAARYAALASKLGFETWDVPACLLGVNLMRGRLPADRTVSPNA
jgi:hypothetical protein